MGNLYLTKKSISWILNRKKFILASGVSFFISSVLLAQIGFATSLEIKRNFSGSEFNSQNSPLLGRGYFYDNFNQGGAAQISYNDATIYAIATPITDPKPEKHSQKEIDRKIRFYKVVKGDTVSAIAKKFGVSQKTIIVENKIKNGRLKIGQMLRILPVSGISYTVKKGDNITSIAKRFSVSVEKIKEFNNLETDLGIGQKIIIPGAKIKEEKKKRVKKYSNRKVSYSKSVSAGKIGYAGDGNVKRYVNWRGIVPYNKGARIKVPHRRKGRYRYTRTDYGYFTHPAPGTVRTQGVHHRNGVDMGGPVGTNIYAAASGKVIKSYHGGWGGGYGNHILIQHPNGLITMYAHLSKNLVWKGEYVKKGQLIAKMGSTGRSTGPHLHFEVRGGYNPF